jgi:chromosomal replication initiator protein
MGGVAPGEPVTTIELDVSAALAEAIARRIGEPRYRLWFDRNTRFSVNNDVLAVGVPNRHFQEWLQKTFGAAVCASAEDVFNRPMEVQFRIDPALFQAARREQAAVEAKVAPSPEPPPMPAVEPKKNRHAKPQTEKPTKPEAPQKRSGRRWLKLSDFVVGTCNRVAHASALSVVESPGDGGNPLVLHGPVGTGKTHLLEGIYCGLRRNRPDWKVTYITAEDFTNRFVQAMRHGKLNGFRKTFRECDVLLVDDLHFLATKKATQEEFLHTFDVLLADGRQLVVTADCHPRLADDFTPELTDRLLGGAVWGLAPPDRDTRQAILRVRYLERAGIPLPEDVTDFLGERLRGNIRELEGAVASIRHYARVTGRPVNVALVSEALTDLLRHAVRVVQVADVDRVVCAILRLETGSLQSKSRAWAISHPRMVAMYLARKHTAAAYSEIGGHFSGLNHSTVVAAEKRVRKWLDEDGELALGDRRVRVRELVERAERDVLRG